MAGLQTDTWHLERADGTPHKIQRMKGTDFITLSLLPLVLRAVVFLCSLWWSAFSFWKKELSHKEGKAASLRNTHEICGLRWADCDRQHMGLLQPISSGHRAGGGYFSLQQAGGWKQGMALFSCACKKNCPPNSNFLKLTMECRMTVISRIRNIW